MADIELAVSEKILRELFDRTRDRFAYAASGYEDMGSFSAAWAVGIKLRNGTLDLQGDNTLRVSELDILYETLSLTLGLDLPKVCIGGFCIIPNPFGGCVVRAPKWCLFEGDPDVTLPINLGGLLRSEVSFTCGLRTERFDNPAGAGLTPWAAHAAGVSDEWRFHLDPGWLDVDPLDVPDIVGDLLDRIIDAVVDDLLGWLPGWARDLVRQVLGALSDVIRRILDLADDVDEWLSNLLGTSLGVLDMIAEAVLDHFAAKDAILAFPDPYPMLPAEAGPGGTSLVPVLIPVLNPALVVSDTEMTLSASVGA